MQLQCLLFSLPEGKKYEHKCLYTVYKLKFIIISRHLIMWLYSIIHLTISNLRSGRNSLVALGSNYFLLNFEILQNYFILIYPFSSLCLPFRSKTLDLKRFRQRQLLFQDIFFLLICASYVIQNRNIFLEFYCNCGP